MSTDLKILDVSKYQSKIDYSKAVTAIDGVIIRLGYRGYSTSGTLAKDTLFDTHMKGFVNAGIKRIGVYFLSQAINEKEAVEEAEFCIKTLTNYKINFPIYLDSEWSNTAHNGRADSLSKSDRTKISIAFLNKIKSSGYTAGIYASTSWFSDKLDDSQLKNFSHWVADYRTKNGYGTSDGWQYTETGTINGISAKVDLSHFYKDFSSTSTTTTTSASTSTATSSTTSKNFSKGQAVKLTKANLYASQDSQTPVKQISGTYYIYDGVLMKQGRYRITSQKNYCGKGAGYITGYVAYTNFK
jgi:GH25 family lysozyme M1 (1,4-beta-N-acetylmuramidase)